MRIALDARPLCHKASHGIPNYVRRLLREIAQIDRENEYLLYAHKDFEWAAPAGFRWKKRAGNGLYGTLWLQTQAPLWLRQDDVDIFWATQHILPLAAPRNVRCFVTVYDLVFRRFPETMAFKNLWIQKLLAAASFRRADLLGPISESTSQDLMHFYGSGPARMRVISPAADKIYRPMEKTEARRALRPILGADAEAPYLLTVGTLEPRKNLKTALKAFARLMERRPHKLLVVGSAGWKMGGVLENVLTPALKSRVRFLGHLPDEALPPLYAAADAFLFPSLFEGFGIPVVEAMACGTPVVISNAPSLPEVAGGAALAVDPLDDAALAAAIEQVLDDAPLRERLVRGGFESARRYDWRASGEKLLEALGSLK